MKKYLKNLNTEIDKEKTKLFDKRIPSKLCKAVRAEINFFNELG
jgi:hypothetical protein